MRQIVIFFTRAPRKVIFPILGLVWVLAGVGAGGWFFPLEVGEIQNRFNLWRSNVKSFEKEGWAGYLRDGCQSGVEFSKQNCSCVLLLHGLGDHSMTWKKILQLSDSEWKKNGQIQPVKILALDLRGSGRTERVQDLSKYRVRKQAAEIRTVLASICPYWTVVGNSFGGWVASWLALDWPEVVSRLVLISPVGTQESLKTKNDLTEPTLDSLKEFQKKAYFRPRQISDREWEAILQHLKMSQVRAIAQAQQKEDYLDGRLSALKKPILLLWGQADRVVPIEIGKQIRSFLPSASWREVSECGHLPQKECPAVVVQSIIDMLHFGAM